MSEVLARPTEVFSRGGPWIPCECCHGTGKANAEAADGQGLTLAEAIEEYGDHCCDCEGSGWKWPLGEAVLSCTADVSECATCDMRQTCGLTARKLA